MLSERVHHHHYQFYHHGPRTHGREEHHRLAPQARRRGVVLLLCLKSTLLLASAYGVLDPIQLYANVALLAAALWFTYRYFTEVWPNREKVYVPEPWKGD